MNALWIALGYCVGIPAATLLVIAWLLRRDRIAAERFDRHTEQALSIQRHPSSLPLNLTGYDHTLGSDFTQWAKECSE